MASTIASGSTGAGASSPVVITGRDLVFYCPHCEGELVVDRDGVGLEVHCPHCKRLIVVPDEPAPAAAAVLPPSPAPAPPPPPQFNFAGFSPEQIASRIDELRHQLKENNSQDTEMRGHINRATIELHRLQLKLKKLTERKMSIEAELAALKQAAANPS